MSGDSHAVLESFAKTERIGQRWQRDIVHACAAQFKPPVVCQPAEQSLVQVDLLNRAQLEFLRRAPEQSALEDEALIRHPDFGSPYRQQIGGRALCCCIL